MLPFIMFNIRKDGAKIVIRKSKNTVSIYNEFVFLKLDFLLKYNYDCF